SRLSSWLCEVVSAASATVLVPYAAVVPYATWLVAGSSVVQLIVAFVWLIAVATTPLMTGGRVSGGGVVTVAVAGRISMPARFHLSLVGAASITVTASRVALVPGA